MNFLVTLRSIVNENLFNYQFRPASGKVISSPFRQSRSSQNFVLLASGFVKKISTSEKVIFGSIFYAKNLDFLPTLPLWVA